MLILAPENRFSRDYQTARKRFLKSAATAGATMSRFATTIESAQEPALSTDIAWFGTSNPRKALLVTSGIHGVEGFAGSALQLAVMEYLPELPDDTALVLVHVLNPFGMQNLRRFNANNVDLNRNFHFAESDESRDNPGYAELDELLNPPNPPKVDGFHLKLFLKRLSMGSANLTQAVAGGQYQFPKGIFYGGATLEPEAAAYINWLRGSALRDVEKLMVLDVHTGLGAFGEQSLLLRSDSINCQELSKQMRLPIISDEKGKGVLTYDHDGGCSGIYPWLFPQAETGCLTVEYGTYPGGNLVYALRIENQHHHYGNQSLTHKSKKKLKEAFCPHPDIWRKRVVTQGIELVERAVGVL